MDDSRIKVWLAESQALTVTFFEVLFEPKTVSFAAGSVCVFGRPKLTRFRWRIGAHIRFLVIGVALDGDGIDLAEPAAQVNLLAPAAAKWHGHASGRIEFVFANGTTEHGCIVRARG